MLRFILFTVLFYLAYKLIFDLVIPIFQTTHKIRKGFQEMQDRMQEKQPNHSSKTASTESVKKTGDYIDFEEIK